MSFKHIVVRNPHLQRELVVVTLQGYQVSILKMKTMRELARKEFEMKYARIEAEKKRWEWKGKGVKWGKYSD